MEYKLEDLIDIPLLQDLQEKLNKIYTFPSAIIDNDGKILTAVAWQDICTKFHRTNPDSEIECIRSDQYILEHLHEANSVVSYKCPHGLVDNATPIIIDGKHLGNFFTGQFFLENPDLNFFRNQAKKYGFDERAYLKAVEKVPVWTKEKLSLYLDFIKGFIEIIAELGLKNLKEIEIRKALTEKENLHRSILQTAMDGYWLVDFRGNFLEVNQAYCKMSGYSREELLNMSIADIEAIETKQDTEAHIKSILENGEDRFESRHLKKDGTYFDVEVAVKLQSVDDAFIVCFLHDITKRKESERKLQEAQTKYQFIVENTNDILWTMSPKLEFDYVSPSVEKFLGYTPEEHLKQSLDDYLTPQSAAMVREEFETGMINLQKKDFEKLRNFAELEIEYVRKDKVHGFATISMNIVRDEHYNIVKIIGKTTDITDKKRADMALKESEEKYRQLVELSPDAILIHSDGIIQFVNSAAVILFEGKSKNDLIGRKIIDFVHPEFCQTVQQRIETILDKDERVPLIEEKLITLKGNELYAEVAALPISINGKSAVQVVARDISAKKRTEEELSVQRYYLEKAQSIGKIGTWSLDLRKNLLIWTEENYKIFGIPVGTTINYERFLNCVHPDDREYVDINWKAAMRNEPYNIVHRLLIDNKIKWVREKAFVEFDENGSAISAIGITHDITEQKLAETALREIEEQFSLFMKYTPVYTFIKEVSPTESRVLQASDNFENMVGISGKNMIGKTMTELFPEELAIKMTKDDWNLHENGEVFQVDEDLNGRNYTTIKFPLVKEGKNLLAGFTIDITERKQMEAKLREKDIEFRKLSANVPDLIFQFTRKPDGSYSVPIASEGIKNIFGCSPEDVRNDFTPIAKVIYPEDTERVINDIEYSAKNLTYFTCEFRVQIPGKEVQWIYSRSSPEKLSDGSITWYGFNVDITALKNAEKELIKAKEFAENLITTSNAIIVGLDNTGKVTLFNHAAEEITGYTIEDLEGKNWFEVLVPKDKYPGVWKEFVRLVKGGVPKHYENPIITKSGEERFVIWQNSEIFENGKVVGTISYGIDITEQKKAEKELIKAKEKAEESEKRFKDISFSIGDWVWEVDENGVYTYSSQKGADIFGIPNSAIIGKTPFDFMLPEEVKKISQTFAEIMANKLPIKDLENWNVNKNGELICLLTNGVPVYNNSGEFIGYRGVDKDITEQKKAEKELIKAKEYAEENEAKFRNFFDQSLIGFALTSPAKCWIEVNDEVCNYLGYSREDLFKKTWAELTHPDDLEYDLYHFNRLIKREIDGYKIDKRFIHKNGQIVYTELSLRCKFDAEGQPEYFLALINNISERKYLEFDLISSKEIVEESEFKLKEAQKTAHIGHWEWDLKKQTLSWSDEIFNIFGVTRDSFEVSAENFEKTIHPDDLENFLKVRKEGLTKNEEINIEHRIVRPDGEIRYVQEHSKILRNSKNEAISVFGTVLDITDLKNTANELVKAKEKAEESDRLKSAFLANMSHEIRTPMNGILGFADLLKSPELSGEKQKEFIKIIEQSGNRMLDIINDIINISKVEAGLMEVALSETNINKQIDYIFSFFKPEVEAKGLTFICNKSQPNDKVNIRTDFQKFNSILTNLVKNAIKFTSSGSIEIGYFAKGDYIEFFVKDTGIGIPESQREIIFERFRQGSEQLNRKYEGSGLGLSISKAYVEMLGGKIWLESEQEKGTVFYFTLPFIPLEQLKEEPADISGNNILDYSAEKRLKVLIVEDDETSMMLNKLTLENISRELLTASNGKDAVTLCTKYTDIDLVLMDIQLPEMDGYQATQKIREFNKNVVIIAQTAFALAGDKEKALEAGCNDYLAKPFNKAKLNEKINKFFKK